MFEDGFDGWIPSITGVVDAFGLVGVPVLGIARDVALVAPYDMRTGA